MNNHSMGGGSSIGMDPGSGMASSMSQMNVTVWREREIYGLWNSGPDPGPGNMQPSGYGPGAQQYNPNNQYQVNQSSMQYNTNGMQPNSMNYPQTMNNMQNHQTVKAHANRFT